MKRSRRDQGPKSTSNQDVAVRAIDTAGKVAEYAFGAAPPVVAALCAVPIVQALAGLDTSLTVAGFDWLGGSTLGDVLPWSITAGSMLLTYRERRLRQKTTERLGDTTRQLELLHDPSRTSSGLRKDGTSPREDEGDNT